MISRKIAAVALSIFMAFAACACNGGTNSDSTDISSESSESSIVSETSSDNSSEPESPPSAVALQYAEQSDEIGKFYKEISEKKDFPAINITTLDSARISSKTKYVDSVWLVTAPEAVRVARIIKRDGCTPAQAEARIRAQMSEEEKRAYSSEVIDNSSSIGMLYEQIDALYKQYAGAGANA